VRSELFRKDSYIHRQVKANCITMHCPKIESVSTNFALAVCYRQMFIHAAQMFSFQAEVQLTTSS